MACRAQPRWCPWTYQYSPSVQGVEAPAASGGCSICDCENKTNLSSGSFSQALVNQSTLTCSSKSAWRTPRHPTAASHDADNCQNETRPFPSVEASSSHPIVDGCVASQSRYSAFWSSSMACPCSRQNYVKTSKENASAEGFSTFAMLTLKSTRMQVVQSKA